VRLEANDIRELQLLKYYRLVRRWACKTYDLKDADLELLIYFDCIVLFTRDDYIKGTYTYSWDKKRWERLRKNGWIDVYSKRNQTTIKYNVFKISTKGKHLINRMYKIMLGEEDLPLSSRSVFFKNKTYTDKVYNKAIDDMFKDNTR